MYQHWQVKYADGESPKQDWNEVANVAEEYEQNQCSFAQMIEEFETIWDGNFGQIKTAKHGME